MIARHSQRLIEKRLDDPKAIIVLGARQVGKSTLLKQIEPDLKQPVVWWNGDETDIRNMLQQPTSSQLSAYIGSARTVIIDEAQRIENIGLCIKLITDNLPGVKVIATGSSAFELANVINEPLTGRKWEYQLYPLSYGEMVEHNGLLEEKRLLQHRLVFGYYPEIVNHPGDESARLSQLIDSYLYKDILTWQRILKPDRMEKLVQALAFQVGHEVSYRALGQISGLDNETVEKYIQLLEKVFIVFRLGPFNRNLRNELKKSRKIYFFDNGIRNAVINQFNPVDQRNDIGALWENFLVSERIKALSYKSIRSNRFFWRTHAQQEIDYIEERGGSVFAYEFKWGHKKVRFPQSFLNAYSPAGTSVITRDNMDSFLLSPS